ncbi:response regulator transcription factor [Methylocystis sp. 9N]|uniref:Response regulator transcription factor n=1 Tax=Methylocystis borbori TaxID=3118750 RepID=A0ABU7XH91_9HYPH
MPRFLASRNDSTARIRLSSKDSIFAPSLNSPERARILIVSDVRMFREALDIRLREHGGMDVVGAVERDGALAALVDTAPEFVLLDAGELEGLVLAQALVAQRPELRIVAFGAPSTAHSTLAAACQAIVGLVPREGSFDDIVETLETLATTGKRDRAKALRAVRLASDRERDEAPPSEETLTGREREILQLIERGLSNKEIARELRIEVGTVKNHVHNMLQKLQVRGRGEAAHSMRLRSLPI